MPFSFDRTPFHQPKKVSTEDLHGTRLSNHSWNGILPIKGKTALQAQKPAGLPETVLLGDRREPACRA
jgi:hypothetical protein